MEPRVAGAGIAMAIAMMVLLPTFNALNNSYVTDVAPPAWLAKLIDPEDIPEDFQPPEDFTPPEDWEPPPDFEPPPGWEPPPGYEGPIPPGGCPPPAFLWPDGGNMTEELSADGQREWTFRFTVPQYTVGVSASINFTNWAANEVYASLEAPDGEVQEDSEQGDVGGLLNAATPRARTQFTFQFIAQDENNMPPSGTYTFTFGARDPVIQGSATTEIGYAVACGGMLR